MGSVTEQLKQAQEARVRTELSEQSSHVTRATQFIKEEFNSPSRLSFIIIPKAYRVQDHQFKETETIEMNAQR